MPTYPRLGMRQIAKLEETDDGQHAHTNFTDGVVVFVCLLASTSLSSHSYSRSISFFVIPAGRTGAVFEYPVLKST